MGHKACHYDRCKFDHPTTISEEDTKWAKQYKPAKPRRNSPAAGATRSNSSGSERKSKGKKNKNKNKNKNKGKDEGGS